MSEVLLDDRTGSGDLTTYLAKWRIPHSLTRLPYGDAAVEGAVGSGVDVVGVEIKQVRDALCCMRDGRFSGHQLPGLLSTYQAVWLIIEGSYGVDYSTGVMTRPGKKGMREPLRLGKNGPGFMYSEFNRWLLTMEVKAGVHVRRSGSRIETAKILADLALWWEKPFNSHKSHLALHVVRPDAAILTPITVGRKIASQLPGVGWQRSAEIVKSFRTAREMVDATPEDWATVDGIGKTTAKRIWEALHNADS